jgi:hypothetical protein
LDSGDCAELAEGYWLGGERPRCHGLYHSGEGDDYQGRLGGEVAVNDKVWLALDLGALGQVRSEVSELFGLCAESAE